MATRTRYSTNTRQRRTNFYQPIIGSYTVNNLQIFSTAYAMSHPLTRLSNVRTLSTPFHQAKCLPCRVSSTFIPAHGAPTEAALPARWLSDLKQRIGKCIVFGLSQEQIDEVGNIMKIVARDWRELFAGSEGYLTGRGRAGCEGREVVWGEMVRFVQVWDRERRGEKVST